MTTSNEILFPEQVPAVRAETARDLRHLTGELRRVAHWSNPARLKEEGLQTSVPFVETILPEPDERYPRDHATDGLAATVHEQLADVPSLLEAATQATGVDLAIAKARGLLPIALAALLAASACGPAPARIELPLALDCTSLDYTVAPGYRVAYADVAVAPGDTLIVHFDARASDVFGRVTVQATDAQAHDLGAEVTQTITEYTDWTTYSLTVSPIPAGATIARVFVLADCTNNRVGALEVRGAEVEVTRCTNVRIVDGRLVLDFQVKP